MMLFHTQHAFNPAYVKTGKDWSFRDAALIGSSFISVVPWWFRWATFGIEYHHIHHLSTKVPSCEGPRHPCTLPRTLLATPPPLPPPHSNPTPIGSTIAILSPLDHGPFAASLPREAHS